MDLRRRAADVDVANNDGITALMRAAGGGHTAVVEALAGRAADVNAADNNGRFSPPLKCFIRLL